MPEAPATVEYGPAVPNRVFRLLRPLAPAGTHLVSQAVASVSYHQPVCFHEIPLGGGHVAMLVVPASACEANPGLFEDVTPAPAEG